MARSCGFRPNSTGSQGHSVEIPMVGAFFLTVTARRRSANGSVGVQPLGCRGRLKPELQRTSVATGECSISGGHWPCRCRSVVRFREWGRAMACGIRRHALPGTAREAARATGFGRATPPTRCSTRPGNRLPNFPSSTALHPACSTETLSALAKPVAPRPRSIHQCRPTEFNCLQNRN